MKLSKMFPSKWLSSADIEGHTPNVKIRAITVERVGAPPKDEDKYVMWFEGKQKGLILNKTNGMAVGAMYGDETDNWMGKPVQLYVAKVRAFGAVHDAIRVRSSGTVSAAPLPVHDADDDVHEHGDLEFTLDDVAEVDPGANGNAPEAAPYNPFEDEPSKQTVIAGWGAPSDAMAWAKDAYGAPSEADTAFRALVADEFAGTLTQGNAADVYAAWYDKVTEREQAEAHFE